MREEPNSFAATQVDTEFRSRISFEIRTAMNSIVVSTNLMLDTKLSPEQAKYLQDIKSAAEHLMTITEELLAPGTNFPIVDT
jgi:signal transduction histidine kinase